MRFTPQNKSAIKSSFQNIFSFFSELGLLYLMWREKRIIFL